MLEAHLAGPRPLGLFKVSVGCLEAGRKLLVRGLYLKRTQQICII